MVKDKKKRLDVLLTEQFPDLTRSKAQGLIMAGEVTVNGVVADKPGHKYSENDEVILKEQPRFVSRGGEKLDGALDDFGIDVRNRIAADVGASTGGFTDCLLSRGIDRVYAIDVGYGQLAYKLRVDKRVKVIERTNARHIDMLEEPVNLVVIDASYISLKLILPAVIRWLDNEADIVALIKPQFEAGKSDVGKGGLVSDRDVHARVIKEVCDFAQSIGLMVQDLTISPIKGLKSGNSEFLIWLRYNANRHLESPLNIEERINIVIDRV